MFSKVQAQNYTASRLLFFFKKKNYDTKRTNKTKCKMEG